MVEGEPLDDPTCEWLERWFRDQVFPVLTPQALDLINRYRERAKGQGIDPFGYNFVPYVYAAAQVLATAVQATQSLAQRRATDRQLLRELVLEQPLTQHDLAGENGILERHIDAIGE